jgi:hypothetical protein
MAAAPGAPSAAGLPPAPALAALTPALALAVDARLHRLGVHLTSLLRTQGAKVNVGSLEASLICLSSFDCFAPAFAVDADELANCLRRAVQPRLLAKLGPAALEVAVRFDVARAVEALAPGVHALDVWAAA